jgi:magnesium transporter
MNLRLGRRMKIDLRFRRRSPPGSTPGTVAVDPKASRPVVRVMSYGPDDLEERGIDAPDGLDAVAELVGRRPVTWVDVQGLGDAATITRLGEIFGLHPLAMEDVVNTHQRSKVEDYGAYLFIVIRAITPGDELDTEQIGLFLGENFVLTFQERLGDCYDPVRTRLRTARGKIRGAGADYLAYA